MMIRVKLNIYLFVTLEMLRSTPPERGNRNYSIRPGALTLYGVGTATSISNIEVFNAGDDAYLLWGGSVEPSYLTAYIFGDECFEMDCGWSGN
jgi:hypothetical protein